MRAFHWLSVIGLALLAGVVLAQPAGSHDHGFHDADMWAQVFDDPSRDAWQKPHEVIQALALKSEAKVADLGAGTGYFSARLAKMLPKGTVYAVDIEPEMVEYLKQRARREGLKNVVAVQARPDDAYLPAKMDLVLVVDVYHHINDRVRYFEKLKDSLAPGARLAVIDFRPEAKHGPRPASRIAAQTVKDELAAAGYALAAEHAFLPEQYFLVFGAKN